MAWPEAEATLDELLKEPIIRLIMRRDAASEAEIRKLMARLDGLPREQRSFGEGARARQAPGPMMT